MRVVIAGSPLTGNGSVHMPTLVDSEVHSTIAHDTVAHRALTGAPRRVAHDVARRVDFLHRRPELHSAFLASAANQGIQYSTNTYPHELDRSSRRAGACSGWCRALLLLHRVGSHCSGTSQRGHRIWRIIHLSVTTIKEGAPGRRDRRTSGVRTP